MNRVVYFIAVLFFLLFIVKIAVFAEGGDMGGDTENPIIKKIEIGMTPSQVRAVAGMPRNMTRAKWRYNTFFVIFEKGMVACLVDNTCFGKWPNCRAYKERSGPCVKK